MKKLLSILLTGVMLVSVFAISASAFVPTRVTTVIPETYPLNETFDNAETAAFVSTTTKAATVENGYIKVDASNKYGVTDLNAPDIASFTADKYTVEFTVRKSGDTYIESDKDYTIGFGICRAKNESSSVFKKFGIIMPIGDLDNDVTRTYKFTVDETAASGQAAFSNVTIQDGSAAAQTLTHSNSWTAGHWDNETASNYIGVSTSGFSIRTVHGTSDTHGDLVLYVESVKITVPGSSSTTDLAIKNGVNYSQDFDAGLGNFVESCNISNEAMTESDGNTFYRLSASDMMAWSGSQAQSSTSEKLNTGYSRLDNTSAEILNIAAPNSTITLDVRYVTKGAPLTLLIAKDANYYENANPGKRPIALGLFPRSINTWYTYKVEIGNYTQKSDDINNFINVYVKERGAADSTYTLLTGVDMGNLDVVSVSDMDSYGYGYKNGWTSPDNGQYVAIGFTSYTLQDTSWTTDVISATVTDIDNFQATTGCAITGSYADGAAELYVDTNETKETVIIASYDADGALVDIAFADLTGGSDNKAELSITEGATNTLYVWNSLAGGKPILTNPATLQ